MFLLYSVMLPSFILQNAPHNHAPTFFLPKRHLTRLMHCLQHNDDLPAIRCAFPFLYITPA